MRAQCIPSAESTGDETCYKTLHRHLPRSATPPSPLYPASMASWQLSHISVISLVLFIPCLLCFIFFLVFFLLLILGIFCGLVLGLTVYLLPKLVNAIASPLHSIPISGPD